MYDVFYYGPKPGIFAHEQHAESINEAISKCRTSCFWYIYGNNDYEDFEFDWQPVPWEAKYTHIWKDSRDAGHSTFLINKRNYVADTNHYYHIEAIQEKIDFTVWDIPKDIDLKSFDFRWKPDPCEPPFIYQFGTQWQKTGGPRYTVSDAEQIKYMNVPQAIKLPNKKYWTLSNSADETVFDFSWHPDETEPPFIYVFGSKYAAPEIKEEARYTVQGATVIKYMTEPVVPLLADETRWEWDDNIDKTSIDFRWRPHPWDPPLIYQFGTQWQNTGGPCYIVPGATDVKLSDAFIAKRLPNKTHWHLDSAVDYSKFDFSWHPHESQKQYKHIFGTQWEHVTDTWYYEGTDENPPVNYIEDVRITSGSSFLSRYLIETSLEDLIAQHPDERFWALSKEMNYDNFDFTWHPNNSQLDYQHVFGSEWQKHSQTFLINAPAWYAGKKELNYVDAVKAQALATYDIFFIDKLNEKSNERFESLKKRYPSLQKTRLINGLLETLKRCATKAKTSLFWVIASDIDYDNFNFSWHPAPWQQRMLHIFGSVNQKWSETLLIDKQEFIRHIRWCKSLQLFPNLNFVGDQLIEIPRDLYDKFFISRAEKENGTYRRAVEIDSEIKFIDGSKNILEAYQLASAQARTDMYWVVDSDSELSKDFDFRFPIPAWDKEYAHICKQDNKYGGVYLLPKKKEITKKETRYRFFRDSKNIDIVASHYRPWDIFFISYNEPNADQNWELLKERFPTAFRIDKVKGIINAHKLAAEKSGTKMFYVVDGDAELVDSFDFNYSVPKWDTDGVFVWHSRNPINDLEYGYGGVKLLPKSAVLNLENNVTDMTTSISKKFNIVSIVSNITAFNTDEFSTWKSAFRECVKLASGLIERQDDAESKARLDVWCNKALDRPFAEWALRGARDGKEFGFNTENDLTLINNFEWLKEYYGKKYNT